MEYAAEIQRLHRDVASDSAAEVAADESSAPSVTATTSSDSSLERASAGTSSWVSANCTGSRLRGALGLTLVLAAGCTIAIVSRAAFIAIGSFHSQGEGIDKTIIVVPAWQPGTTFSYLSLVHDGSDAVGCGSANPTQLLAVNAGLDASGSSYQLTSASLHSAVAHAALNDFPFFGRVTSGHLAVYENGQPQHLFGRFPIDLSADKTPAPWSFRLFHIAWRGELESFDPQGGVNRAGLLSFRAHPAAAAGGGEATASVGPKTLVYALDLGAGFLASLTLLDASGVVQRQFTLQAAAAESTVAEPLFSGQTYFIRAADLLDEQWSLTSTVPPAAVSGEVVLGTHKSGTPWNLLAYSVQANSTGGCAPSGHNTAGLITLVGAGSNATVPASIHPASIHGFTHAAAANITLETCSTVCALTGHILEPLDSVYNYSIVVADRAADSAVVLSGRLRVAGGILYTYTV